jgi:hypothetical protein
MHRDNKNIIFKKKKKEIGADNKHRKYGLEMKKRKKEKTPTKSNNKN